MKKITFIFVFIFFPGVSFAGEACGRLLENGIFNRYFDRSSSTEMHSFRSKMCDQYYRNSQSGASGGLNFPGIGLSVSGSSVNSYGSLYCESSAVFDYSVANNSSLSILASSEVISGYVACLDAVGKGVKFDLQYTSSDRRAARVNVEVAQSPSSRLPIYNGYHVTPVGAAHCEFVAAAGDAPMPGDVLSPAHYALVCSHETYQSDAYVTISLDTVQGLGVNFYGTGDLHSNEYWALYDRINASILELEDSRIKWSPVDPEVVMDLKSVPADGLYCVSLPESVPESAKEIKVSAFVAGGRTPSSHLVFDIFTHDNQNEYYGRVEMHLATSQNTSSAYNGYNDWFPVTQNRQICARRNAATYIGSSMHAAVELLGYR